MARDLIVRVRADVGAYQRAMSNAAKSTDQLARAGLALQKKGLQISNLGDTLTRRVTLPLGLAGAAAIKMAGDFDKSFVQMQTLAGVSAGEVDNLKESVLDLAGETGRAPQELAEALYFLQSSGLDSAQAMDALEQSAKASAVGLGATKDVANAVSSAMLAYAESGLTAAEATDVLIATAREGKAEPAELANQMGRLLPIASELGITFGDVGGAIAALSTKGNNAEQATTQLVNVMSKLLKPSQQAAKLLDQVGISSGDLRKMLAEQGLLGTLEELRSRLGESGFVKYFEDVQAVQGALALLGGDLDKTRGIFEAVNNSVGATDNAFSKWAESMGAQNAQAFAQFQVALIRVGEVLAPIASDVLSFVAQIAEAFSNLPGPVQTAIIAFAGFAAALGPIMSVGGRLITTVGTLIRLLNNFALPAGTISGAFNGTTVAAGNLTRALGTAGVAGALLAVGTGFALFLKSKNEANFAQAAKDFAELDKVTRQAAAGTGVLNDAVKVSTIDFTAAASAQQTFAESGKLTEQGLRDLDKGFASVLEKAPALAEQYIKNAEAAGVPAEKLREWRSELQAKIGDDAAAMNAQDAYNASVEEAAGVTEEATSALQEYADTLKGMFDPLFAAVDAQVANAEAMRQADAAAKNLATAIRDHGAGSTEAAEAQRAYEEANRAVARSAVDEKTALAGLADAVRAGDVSVEDAVATLRGFVASGDLTEAAARQMAAEFGATKKQADTLSAGLDGTTGSAQNLGRQRPQVKVSESGNRQVQAQLGRTRDAAFNVPSRRHTTMSASDNASNIINRVRNAIFGVPTLRTTTMNVVTVYSQVNAGARPTGRQVGGPVSASEWYVVGESGPEIFIPGRSGYIVPNHATGDFASMATGNWGSGGGGGGGGGAATIVNVTVHGSVIAERELVSTINRQLSRGTINKNGRAL